MPITNGSILATNLNEHKYEKKLREMRIIKSIKIMEKQLIQIIC